MTAVAAAPPSAGLAAEVRVRPVQPVLPRRGEDVDVEAVLERDGAMREIARDHQHLAGADGVDVLLVLAEEELEGAFEDVGDLLVVVAVGRDLGAGREVHVGEHHLVAGDQPPPQAGVEGLARHVVPPELRKLGHGVLRVVIAASLWPSRPALRIVVKRFTEPVHLRRPPPAPAALLIDDRLAAEPLRRPTDVAAGPPRSPASSSSAAASWAASPRTTPPSARRVSSSSSAAASATR